MSIKTNELQQLEAVLGSDSVLLDSTSAGTARFRLDALARYMDGELLKDGTALSTALSTKANVDFANLPDPQTALYNLGARPGENILDNWYFSDPINQRGQMEYMAKSTAFIYTIDRWRMRGVPAYVKLTKGGIEVGKMSTGAEGYAEFSQLIEGIPEGTVLTLSVIIDGVLYSGTSNRDWTYGGTNIDNNIFIYFTTPVCSAALYARDNKLVEAVFYIGSKTPLGTHGTITAAKIELGPIQTLAHQDASGNWVLNDPPPNKAMELAKCQRYQYTPFDKSIFSGYGDIVYGGLVTSSSQIYTEISTPFLIKVPALIIPDISVFRLTAKTTSGIRSDIIPESYGMQNYIGGAVTMWFTVDKSVNLEIGSTFGLWVDRGSKTIPLLLDANL